MSAGEETHMEVVVSLNISLAPFRACQLLLAELQNT